MSRKFNALLGLGALAFASSAFAQCPSSPVPPWSAAPSFQGATEIVAGGMAGTSCRLNSRINAGAGGIAFAQVQDNTPAAEPRYRAQFLMNADALSNQALLANATVFSAASSVTGPAVRFTVFGDGAGGKFLGYFVQNSAEASGVSTGSVALAAGENSIEFDLQVGASGSFTLWVNNGNEGSPTVPAIAVNNASAVGVDTAFLGLAAPSPQFVSAHAGANVGFDEFDSRRQTFIGN